MVVAICAIIVEFVLLTDVLFVILTIIEPMVTQLQHYAIIKPDVILPGLQSTVAIRSIIDYLLFIWVVIMLRHMLVATVAIIWTIISLDLFVLATIVIIIHYGLVVAIAIIACLFVVIPKCRVLVMGWAILGVKQLLQQQLLQQPHHVWVIN